MKRDEEIGSYLAMQIWACVSYMRDQGIPEAEALDLISECASNIKKAIYEEDK